MVKTEIIDRLKEQSLEVSRDFGDYITEVNLNKFASLIIKECIKVIQDAAKEAEIENTYMGDDVPSIVHTLNIERHFGSIVQYTRIKY